MILTLRDLEQYCDWRASDDIRRGRAFLHKHSFWFVNFVNGSCNFYAHKLAAWARNLGVDGHLYVTTIPPDVLYHQGGTFVPSEEEYLFNARA